MSPCFGHPQKTHCEVLTYFCGKCDVKETKDTVAYMCIAQESYISGIDIGKNRSFNLYTSFSSLLSSCEQSLYMHRDLLLLTVYLHVCLFEGFMFILLTEKHLQQVIVLKF